jgi:putative membrane protein
MKKLTTVAMLALLALAFQACNNAAKTDSTENADSANHTKDTSNNAMNTGGIAVTEDDSKFAVDAANGGMAEVALAKLALTKATNPQVKEFATMMVKDHSMANDELMALAKTKNITLPATVGTDEQKVMDDLSKKSVTDFDKAYVNEMVDDHKKDISLFEKAASDAKDADVKAFATKTLPTLKMHLEAINKIHDSMK